MLKKFGLGIFLPLIVLALIALFFSYRILEVPRGLTIDEGSFGYNAALLARNGTDQNNRFLPIFVLASDGMEWRQPVTQYYLALFFKIFGSSVFNLRFSSVIITLVSAVLLFFLAEKLLGRKGAFFSTLVFLLTPLIMIQSHLGLDNIMPIPFGLLWLIGIFLFLKTKKRKHLVLAAVSLGIGFYTYKGMRAIVPVWCVLTVLYLFISQAKTKKFIRKTIEDIIIFSLILMPFFAIIPGLERVYAGAVFGRQQPAFSSVYDFFYPYLSSFDPTFLFIKGDATLYHSTQRHGMMLLATAPLFLVGCYQAIKKKKFWLFILIAFFSAPLLYGLVNSVYRASRLMVIIPPYALLAALGAVWLWGQKRWWKGKFLLVVVFILMLFNYFDFVKYYWFTYPKFTEGLFGNFDLNCYKSYEALAKEAEKRNLTPYISESIYKTNGDSGRFFETAYFAEPPEKIQEDLLPPPGSIIMTGREEVPGMERLDVSIKYYHLQAR